MAQHAHVPKFGNWDNSDVPYTQHFDDARRGRNAGRMINPNDPQENPEAFSQDRPSAQAPSSKIDTNREAARRKHERRSSKEDVELHRPTDSPARYDNIQKPFSDSPHHRRARRVSTGSDHSVEQSPLHPNSQPKPAKSGVSSSPLERRISSESHGVAPRTPGRSRLRQGGRGDETPEKGSTVPEFGEWEKDPASADGYTGIFDNLRAERHDGSARVPIGRNDSAYADKKSESASCSCFSWLKK
ncbi:hypothetical protein J5N97_007237 [Dioscorea zingiberensis]|uniref:RIN4 pathogenic type III effector avirulence factor Avr cleavage site domain-containing protein n=1 Tax=Dioscorea zingiberensis TaxID=325984 RepID=A0A9D5DBE7_9LILI|nr:hypothetical protein J5N97_007237 [Dioscorea zingiberensis]